MAELSLTGTGAASRRGHMASLRWMLFAAFLVVAVIPVGLLAVWTQRTAYENELAEVSERHLLLARNLSHALNRYARDLEAVFELSIAAMRSGTTMDGGLSRLLVDMGFEHDCIVDGDGRPISVILNIDRREGYYTPEQMARLRALAADAEGEVAFSGVMGNWAGVPKLVIVKQLDNGDVALGAIGTDYLVKLQKAIAFGERGHSAIVDQNGRVLAHPNESWRLEMKDISKIRAVARMMAGETGVETFYSPAMDADMIAGFTSVERTGWGVMVPQPLAELEIHAGRIQSASILIGLVGLLVALLLAWVIARHLALPIERMAAVARDVERGVGGARVEPPSGASPREIASLSDDLNRMLTELERSNEQLRVKADEAEAANRAKSRFLANMTHELRTPLTAVIGYSEIMSGQLVGPLPDAYRAQARDINAAGVHLLQIVEEILLLTRSEAGKLEAHNGPTDPAACVRFAVSLLKPRADEGGVALETDIPDELTPIESDEAKLRQVIINLLSNAVKFTERGGRVTVSAFQAAGGGVSIEVTDTGIGIAEEDMPKVLEPFGQIADAYDRGHGGVGLGLPLTVELVALLGGRFDLKSKPGEGTVAKVDLPSRTR